MLKRIIILAVGAALLYGAVTLLREEPQQSPPATTALTVTVVKPHRGRITETIDVIGATVPREEIQVMSELSNVRLRQVLADVGDSVKRGQKLAVLDCESLANQLIELRSNYERAHDAFSRVDGIRDTGAVSAQLVTETLTAMQAAKAKLNNGELNLKRSTIIAPEAGVIFERKAVVGGLVNSSEPLFRIAQRYEIEIEVMVPESVLPTLKVDQPVSVKLAGENTPTYGTIRLITPRVDDATRMAGIRIRLHNTNPVFVNLFAIARIMQPEREGMLLPKTALQHDDNGDFVWILSGDNKAKRLPIKVTLFNDEQVMVDAISPNARVIARAGAFIREGDNVHVATGE